MRKLLYLILVAGVLGFFYPMIANFVNTVGLVPSGVIAATLCVLLLLVYWARSRSSKSPTKTVSPSPTIEYAPKKQGGLLAPLLTWSAITAIVRLNLLSTIAWQGDGEIFISGVLAIAIAVAYVFCGLFVNKATKFEKMPWKSPDEGTAMGMSENNGFGKMVMNMAGMGFGEPLDPTWKNNDEYDAWTVIPKTGRSLGEILLGKAWLFYGIRWGGFYPWRQNKKYKFTWASATSDDDNPISAHSNEEISHIYTKRVQYVHSVKNLELKGGLPCNANFIITGMVVNPARAIFRFGREGSWLAGVFAEIDGDITAAFKKLSYQDVAGGGTLPPEGKIAVREMPTISQKEISDELEGIRKKFLIDLIQHIGFLCDKIELRDIDPAEGFREVTTELLKKIIGADSARAEALGFADSLDIRAEGEVRAFKRIDDAVKEADDKTLRYLGIKAAGTANLTLVARDIAGASVLVGGGSSETPTTSKPPAAA